MKLTTAENKLTKLGFAKCEGELKHNYSLPNARRNIEFNSQDGEIMMIQVRTKNDNSDTRQDLFTGIIMSNLKHAIAYIGHHP